LAAALLVVTMAGVAIGASVESDDHHESAEGIEEGSHDEGADAAEPSDAAGDEGQVLGVDTESPALVAVGVALSLALAAGLWFSRDRRIAWTAAAFAALFSALDIAEAAHHLDEERGGLAALAISLAIGHGAAAGLAVLSTQRHSNGAGLA